MSESPMNITMLLQAAQSGERGDVDALVEALYQDMRRLAQSHLNSERRDHTLDPTALVHEAYVKLIEQHHTDWKDRLHFFAVASRIIRRILIDHARARLAAKRGGAGTRVSLTGHGEWEEGGDKAGEKSSEHELDVLALDEALGELAQLDEMQARIVELRYFGGCTVEEIADLLDIGKRSVDRHWQTARAWLFDRLGGEGRGEGGGEREVGG